MDNFIIYFAKIKVNKFLCLHGKIPYNMEFFHHFFKRVDTTTIKVIKSVTINIYSERNVYNEICNRS